MKSSLPLEPPVDVQEFAAENAASQGKSGAGNALVSVFLKFNMNFSLKYERNYSIIPSSTVTEKQSGRIP